MNTNLPLESRLAVVHEIFLVVGRNSRICDHYRSHTSVFNLVLTILEDGVYDCTARESLISVLKKSPVWEKVKPFLKNDDPGCARKGCNCHYVDHEGNTGKCSGTHYGKWDGSKYDMKKCTCPQYVKKTF